MLIIRIILTAFVIVSCHDSGFAVERRVSAGNGSIAVGGDLKNSVITIGVSEELFEKIVRERDSIKEAHANLREGYAALKAKSELNDQQMVAVLNVLGEQQVPRESLALKFLEIAHRLQGLLGDYRSQKETDERLSMLQSKAKVASEQGRFEEADGILKRMQDLQRERLDKTLPMIRSAASTAYDRGMIALSRLSYEEGLGHLEQASDIIKRSPQDFFQLYSYDYEIAKVQCQIGYESAVNGALAKCKKKLEDMLRYTDRDKFPEKTMEIEYSLAVAIFNLVEAGDYSVSMLEEALSHNSKANDIANSSSNKNINGNIAANRGAILYVMGRKSGDVAKLAEALNLLRAATEPTGIEEPGNPENLDYGPAVLFAATFLEFADLTGSFEHLVQATNILANLSKRLSPDFNRATVVEVRTSYAAALLQLYQRSDADEVLNAAIDNLEVIEPMLNKSLRPNEWAEWQTVYGVGMFVSGQRHNDTEKLAKSIDSLKNAIAFRSLRPHSDEWAQATHNLANSYSALAELRKEDSLFRQAIGCYNKSIEVYDRVSNSSKWSAVRYNMGQAFLRYAKLKSSRFLADKAIEAFNDALLVPWFTSYKARKRSTAILISQAKKLRAQMKHSNVVDFTVRCFD